MDSAQDQSERGKKSPELLGTPRYASLLGNLYILAKTESLGISKAISFQICFNNQI